MARRVYEPRNRREPGADSGDGSRGGEDGRGGGGGGESGGEGGARRRAPYGSARADSREGGKEFTVYWAQAGCTLRCKNDEVPRQNGGSRYADSCAAKRVSMESSPTSSQMAAH